MNSFVISEEQAGNRLDTFVTERLEDVNRSSVRKLIDDGKIKVNELVVKAGYKLRENDKVSVDFDFEKSKVIPDVELPIIFENDDCVVIDKPAGILTHSKGVFNPEATVATFISDKIEGMEGDRAGIVHRLDRATSGVILCAKTPEALTWFQKQFSLRKVKKTYYAIISGSIDPKKAIIDMPIERNPKHPQTFRVGVGGKPATTSYEVTNQSDQNTLVKLTPTTGRTHQLRVHLAKLKHPIVGDTMYDGEKADRLYLHASSLEITMPNSERKVFDSKLPKSFNEFMESI